MRDQRRVIVLAKAFAVVGIVFALHGTVTDRAATYRIGMITMVAAAAASLHLTSRHTAQEIMAQQVHVARLTVQERQAYAEMGYKAARLDALSNEIPERAGDAEIVSLPHARDAHQMRRDGSA
jgi:hypothetical protein